MSRFPSTAIAFAAATGFASSANADLNYLPGQTEDGMRYIVVQGQFEMTDNLTQFSRLVETHRPAVVGFDSPGGAVYKAMELGKLIRFYKLGSLQPKAFDCVSACALAFLGGIERRADTGAIGVHKSSFSADARMNVEDAVATVQHVMADTISYIGEMGADPALLQLTLRYESWDMRYLSTSEMIQYRVVTSGHVAPVPLVSQPDEAPRTVRVPDPKPQHTRASFEIPAARSGQVRHPEGFIFLREETSQDGAKVAKIANGSKLKIIGTTDRWYHVRVGNHTGYLHQNWVKVDQFVASKFSRRHIQLASFENHAEAQKYVNYATLPVSIHLASNGWFAVSLADTFDAKHGSELLKQLKSENRIPDDAFMTYGNTYAVKVDK